MPWEEMPQAKKKLFLHILYKYLNQFGARKETKCLHVYILHRSVRKIDFSASRVIISKMTIFNSLILFFYTFTIRTRHNVLKCKLCNLLAWEFI